MSWKGDRQLPSFLLAILGIPIAGSQTWLKSHIKAGDV